MGYRTPPPPLTAGRDRGRLEPEAEARVLLYPDSSFAIERRARAARDEAALRHRAALRRRNIAYGVVYGVIFAGAIILALTGGL